MFSSRVSAVGVAKSLSATIPHTVPVNGASPYVAEKRNFAKTGTSYSLAPAVADRRLMSSGVSATVNHFGQHQVRFAHTDITCPDFSQVRRASNKDPHQPSAESREMRKFYSVGVTAMTAIPAVYLGKQLAKGYLSLYEATAGILAMARIEVDISGIEEGKALVTIWRGKPLFIRHRTPEEIDEMASTNVGELRDPQPDVDRASNPKWLIVLGICTHLGCVPISHAGDFNGYFCPCHGSHYDVSGRIRKGPAPLNLEVPPYFFEDDTTLVVG